jgi:ketosteroid isomerase-like protein
MTDPRLEEVWEGYHAALNAFVQGDPEPQKQLYSRADGATLCNPLGPPVRGWTEIEATLDRASALLSDGEPTRFERVSEHATEDLAYIVEIERTSARVAGSAERHPTALRVTSIFRREDGEWRLHHRHADTVTRPRGPEALTEA